MNGLLEVRAWGMFRTLFIFVIFLGYQEVTVRSSPDLTSGRNLDFQYFFYQKSDYPKDCHEVQLQCPSTNASGVYQIKPDGYWEPFEVFCELSTNSVGWTVMHRRGDGLIDFDRDWISYKSGFGFLYREFWLGNEKISFLTNQKRYQLVIELTISNGSMIRLSYDDFRVGDEFSDFKLANLGQYLGNTDVVTWCPGNMVVEDGTNDCLRTCENPNICQTVVEGCICPSGLFLNGSDCISQEQCGCYIPEEHTIIAEGAYYVNGLCRNKGVCTNGSLIWDDTYACSSNARCTVRDGIRQCYCNDDYMGDGQSCSIIPLDCKEIFDSGTTGSGVFTIKPTDWPGPAFDVYCNMTDGGGWTVFQRRQDGSSDFFVLWDSYKNGFGNLSNEFWLGNEKLYYLTKQKSYEIRIDFVTREYNSYYGKFDFFRINDESDNYRLSGLGIYTGTVDERDNPDGVFLRGHLNYEFSTADRDNDDSVSNCADHFRSGWWFKDLFYSNPNGFYDAFLDSDISIFCSYIPGPDDNIKYSEMKIRPA